jgi:hypothetical protein
MSGRVYGIELSPPTRPSETAAARVTVHGQVREQDGFPICGDAYSWALRQWHEMGGGR